MRMLEEEQRRKLEEERQQGGTEVSKEDKPERAQLDEDSSTTVLLGPPVTESGEGKNEEGGQEFCQADGGINLYSYTSLRAVLRGHQKVVFRRQKCTTFDVRNSTYFPFYVGHSTRQRIYLYFGCQIE